MSSSCSPRIRTDEEGQGLAEYALILALIAIVAIVALIFLGGQVSDDPLDGRQLHLAQSPRSAAPEAAGSSGGLRGVLAEHAVQTACTH